jgi:hypothetical protein
MTQLVKSWNVMLKGPFDLCAKGWHTSKELVVYGELYCVLRGVTRYAESSVVNY